MTPAAPAAASGVRPYQSRVTGNTTPANTEVLAGAGRTPRARPTSKVSRLFGLKVNAASACTLLSAPARRVPETSPVSPQRSDSSVEIDTEAPNCVRAVPGLASPSRVALKFASMWAGPRSRL